MGPRLALGLAAIGMMLAVAMTMANPFSESSVFVKVPESASNLTTYFIWPNESNWQPGDVFNVTANVSCAAGEGCNGTISPLYFRNILLSQQDCPGIECSPLNETCDITRPFNITAADGCGFGMVCNQNGTVVYDLIGNDTNYTLSWNITVCPNSTNSGGDWELHLYGDASRGGIEYSAFREDVSVSRWVDSSFSWQGGQPDFGVLTPNSQNTTNITIGLNKTSNVNANISCKATALSNPDYSLQIGVGNITYGLNTTTMFHMALDFGQNITTLPPGQSADLLFNITAPPNMKAGFYNGTITVKVQSG